MGNRRGGEEFAIEDRAALHRQVARHTSASTAAKGIKRNRQKRGESGVNGHPYRRDIGGGGSFSAKRLSDGLWSAVAAGASGAAEASAVSTERSRCSISQRANMAAEFSSIH